MSCILNVSQVMDNVQHQIEFTLMTQATVTNEASLTHSSIIPDRAPAFNHISF
jgi:hypothetical protein